MSQLTFSMVTMKLICTPQTQQVRAEAQETLFPEQELTAQRDPGCEWARCSSKCAQVLQSSYIPPVMVSAFQHMPYVSGCNTPFLIGFFPPAAVKKENHLIQSLNF